MGKHYFCDYCNRSFQDNLHNRKKHLNGLQHLKAKKVWYDMFRGEWQLTGQLGQWRPALRSFLLSDKEVPCASDSLHILGWLFEWQKRGGWALRGRWALQGAVWNVSSFPQ